MEKSKLLTIKSGISRLPMPSSTKISKPENRNRPYEDPIRRPPLIMLKRRSKSVTDLQSASKVDSLKPCKAINAARVVKTSSTSNLTDTKKQPVKNILKTIHENKMITKVSKITAKRAAAPIADEATKSKVSKVKIPPYDYKARYNQLNEKHLSLSEKYKNQQQKLTATEKDLQEFVTIKTQYLEIKLKYENICKENNELKEENSYLENDLKSTKSSFATLLQDFNIIKHDFENITVSKNLLLAEVTEKREMITQLQHDLHICKEALRNQEEQRRMMHNTIQDLKGTIRVFCRVRPRKPDENLKLLCNISFISEDTLKIRKSKESMNCITGKPNDLKFEFSFDKVFAPEATQIEIFEELAQLIQSALDGYHVCIFAYGQTGSGKTYTMMGEQEEKHAGMIPRTVQLIFSLISNLKVLNWKYVVEASFLEIYNEIIRDLLNVQYKKHDIQFNEGRGITISNLTTIAMQSAEELLNHMAIANQNRAMAATNFNEHSSRSHAVTKINLKGYNEETGISYFGSLNLVDLAGSENAKNSERMEETKNINKSLSTLGTVMSALHNKENHIPYRNSKLTYLLQSSLGGNSKTLMFVNVSPFEECYNESVNALRFAAKVKEVKIGAKRNKTYLQREKTAIYK